MLSFFQSIQKQVAKAASEVPLPSIQEFRLDEMQEPRIGWLPQADYRVEPLRNSGIPVSPIPAPAQTSPPLLAALRLRASPAPNSPLLSDSVPVAKSVPLPSVPRTASIPFEFEPLDHESHALLDVNGTETIGHELKVSTARNLHRRLSGRLGDYVRDYNRALTCEHLPTQDCLFALFVTGVSDDLHKPLARLTKADGKLYSVKSGPIESRQGEQLLQLPPHAFLGGNGLGNRKSFAQTRGRVTHGMSIWDLLLPLLQRPVSLDLGNVLDLPSNLYGYQVKGVEFLSEHHAALLGDDMGTGKTVQTSVAIRMLFQTAKIRTALIVCPLSVVPNWDRELAKWAGNLAVTVVRGDKERRKTCWRQPAHVWLVTYDTLRNDLEHVLALRKGGFDMLVMDEAQRVKNWSSGITRAIRELRASYRWGLSGTPLENNTDELWTILNVLKPDIAQQSLDWSQGIQSVLKPMFLRRRKQDVLTELPPLIQNPVWLRLEDEQRRSYDQLEEQGVLELHAKGETLTAHNILVLLNKLKQVCNRCPRSGASSKLVWLRDSLHNIAAEGDKALVFSQYTDARFAGADWLEQELYDFGALNYSKASSDAKRKALLASFKEKADHTVFIGHPKTAGLGLNELVVANYVIHFDHWWNPAVMNQATARAHRPGQTKTVFAYDLWIEDTYEEIIFQLLERKQGLYDEVVDSLSAEHQPSNNLAFALANTLFAKHGLKPVQRKATDL